MGDRIARLRWVLDRHPGAAVGVFQLSGDRMDPGPVLAECGIEPGTYRTLGGRALAEFVAPADIGTLIRAGADLVAGTSQCRVRLREGNTADLHLFDVGPTVAVIVADNAAPVMTTPPPTAVEAGPRIGVLHADRNAMTVRVDSSVLALLGWKREELEGHPAARCIHPDDQEEAIVNWIAAMEKRNIPLRWRLRAMRSDGDFLWVECTIVNSVAETGEGEVSVELCDISKEIAASSALEAERQLLTVLAEALPVGVAKFRPDGAIEYHNARLEQLLGRTALPDVGCLIEGHPNTLVAAYAGVVEDGHPRIVAVRGTDRSGAEQFLEWTWRTAPGGGGVVCVNNVTDAIQLRAELERQANTDLLTGCLNRAATFAAIDDALVVARPGAGVTVVFLDLDHFKPVNDRWGHAVGDDVLQTVAGQLLRSVRPGDVVGRVGGDEFVVVAPGMASEADAFLLARRVAAGLDGMPPVGDAQLQVEVSMGVAWAEGGSRRAIMAAADDAMYEAKRERRACDLLAGPSS